MLKTLAPSLLLPLLLTACATPVPVAALCPQPPQVPSVLTLPATTGPSIAERLEGLLKDYGDSLTKAQRQP